MNILLASKSPRRRELLELAQLDFEIVPTSFDESKISKEMEASEYVSTLAKGKALKAFEDVEEIKKRDSLVIGADTIVVLDNEILGKPSDEKEAFKMLKKLSGREHKVYTAVSLVDKGHEKTFFEETKVYFYELSDDEINEYIKSGEPMDKAGSYGIQGLGSLFVRKIDGDYFNVVGLPLARTVRELKNFIVY